MKLLTNKPPLTRNIIRYLGLIPVLFLIFNFFPIQEKIDTHDTFSTAIVGAQGTILAYRHRDSIGVYDNIPVLGIDEATLNVLLFVIAREDPRLLDENSIWGRFWLNYRGISARNFNPLGTGGGSPCCQQTLKWLANPRFIIDCHQRTLVSKLGEMSGAYKFTGCWSPIEVLQMYINEVSWLKADVHGIQLSAVKYFNVRDIRELNLYERYILARSVKGVIAAGIDFRVLMNIPRNEMDSLFANSFRSMLIENGRATEEELNDMLALPVRFRKNPLLLNDQSYLFDLIKPLNDTLKFTGGQYVTTLQSNINDSIDRAFTTYAQTNKSILSIGNSILDANAVVLDMRTGNIIGVNSKPLFSPKGDKRMENHLFSNKPAASTIKALIIAVGLEGGYLNENSILIDQYRERIHNYLPVYYGLVNLDFILKKSLNTALDNSHYRDSMVELLEQELESIYGNELNKLPANYNKSQYCLGQPRLLTLIQISQLFRALVTDGNVIRSRVTNCIINTNNFPFDTIYSWKAPVFKVFSENTCCVMRKLLRAPLQEGGTLHNIAGKIRTHDIVWGKTGTSDSYSSALCILISKPYVIAVSMNYYNMNNAGGKSTIPVPSNSGAGSCGPIALNILNSLKN